MGSSSSGVSGTDGDDVGVVIGSITNVVWIFEIWSSLEAEVAIGVDGEFVCIIASIERPRDGFIGSELRNSGCIFSD